ncbi:MAG TPA: hypothetical protein VJ933_12530, partial [Phaeodactylibacter sp.]|nr:hypothetical protein [Phaeodactylibacter sp.]
MPNASVKVPNETLQTLYDYPFQALAAQDEPLEKLVEKDKTQAKGSQKEKAGRKKAKADERPPVNYQGIVEEISQVIYDCLKKRPDDQNGIYELIQEKVKDPKDKNSTLPLESYLDSSKLVVLLTGKTLRRLLHTKRASRITINILEAFRKVVIKEQEELGQLNYILGDYNLYNIDSVEQLRFQVSNFRLRPRGDSKLIYFSQRNQKEVNKVRLETVGEDKLLIHFVMDDCRMFFYAHVGRRNAPEVIQPVYIYNNRHAQPVASLAVMCRVKPDSPHENDHRLRTPERGLHTTGNPAIDRFLKHRAAMLTAQSGHNRYQRFDISDLAVEPGPFRRDAWHYEKLRSGIKGLYKIYFCERYPSHTQYIRNQFFSSVGVGFLRIYEDAFGRLRAAMKSRRDSLGKVLFHEGWVINDLLQDGNYIILQLYRQPDRDRAVNLFLLLHSAKVMYGSHNIMYDSLKKIGSGAVMLQREMTEGEKHPAEQIAQAFQDLQPSVLLPTGQGLSPKEQRIVNYLSSVSDVHVSPVTSKGRLKHDFPSAVHTGTYKMYSYGKGGVRMGILRIYPSGFVT